MKKAIVLLLTVSLNPVSALAADSSLDSLAVYGVDKILLQRAELTLQLRKNVQEELQAEASSDPSQKSVARSVLYSALAPGLGQFYAKSYIKAGIFAAAEIAAWAVNIRYNRLGDDKNAEYERFGDRHWSEYRYWSYVNYLADVYDYSTQSAPSGGNWYLIDEQFYQENRSEIISTLREHEDEFASFTHRLPDTKTQQYYEMIGKYPGQFGNAWEDAHFDKRYSAGDVTPMNTHYTNLSKDAENLYDKAGYGSMAALLNHLISAVDAGFTTRSYNRRQMRMSYQNRLHQGEYVNMFGVAFLW